MLVYIHQLSLTVAIITIGMSLYEVFTQSVTIKYKCRLCSKGMVILFFTTALTIIFPMMFTYKSHGFWMKTANYVEKPDVQFKYEYLFMLQTERLDSPILCTSIPTLNHLFKEKNRCPIIKVQEEDYNRDSYNDALSFELEALLEKNENIYAVTLFLFFSFKLYNHCYLEMESLGTIQEMTSVPGSRLDYAADLQLIQKVPLHPRIYNMLYNKQIFDTNNFNIKEILKEYSARNVSTRLVNKYAIWSHGRAAMDPFILSVHINYPEVTVLYKPGFWQEIKWAWIQYFPVLIPFILLFREIKKFIFSNHLIHSFIETPWKKVT